MEHARGPRVRLSTRCTCRACRLRHAAVSLHAGPSMLSPNCTRPHQRSEVHCWLCQRCCTVLPGSAAFRTLTRSVGSADCVHCEAAERLLVSCPVLGGGLHRPYYVCEAFGLAIADNLSRSPDTWRLTSLGAGDRTPTDKYLVLTALHSRFHSVTRPHAHYPSHHPPTHAAITTLRPLADPSDLALPDADACYSLQC